MSEIETSAVGRAATALRMSGHHTKAILIQALAAERDALAARVALAEGMAEALEKAVADLTYGAEKARTQKAAHSLFAASAEARTALAAWRAAAAEPPAAP